MSPLDRDDPMRWTLYEGIRDGDDCEGPVVDGPPVAWGESFEVMPVSEHEAALAAARQVDDATVERARKAYIQAAVPHFVGCNAEWMRTALLAALTPESDTGSDTSAAANGLSVPEPGETP